MAEYDVNFMQPHRLSLIRTHCASETAADTLAGLLDGATQFPPVFESSAYAFPVMAVLIKRGFKVAINGRAVASITIR